MQTIAVERMMHVLSPPISTSGYIPVHKAISHIYYNMNGNMHTIIQ